MGESEIAPYKVLQKWPNENLELRHYPAQNWACTQAIAPRMSDMSSSGFSELFKYISGNNVKGQKIAMTRPVLVEIKPGPRSTSDRLYKMGFYMSADECPSPPTPKASSVFIEHRPPLKVYSRVYSGFSNENKLNKEVGRLASVLNRMGKGYRTDVYFSASYNSPFELFNRRNEVWLVADPDS
ncbi:SOUL heme-binding protein, partial [Opisthorchis viverrini]